MTQYKFLKEELKELNSKIELDLYYDINIFSSKESRIVVDQDGISSSNDKDKGVKIRVWDGEKYLEYGQSSLEINSIETQLNRLLKEANENSKLINKVIELKYETEILNKNYVKISQKQDIKETSKVLNEIKNRIRKFDNEVVSARCALIEEEEEHIFSNKYRSLYQKIPLKILVVIAYVKCKDEITRMVYESYVANDFSVFKKFESEEKEFNQKIINTKKVKRLKGGKYHALLSPKLTGLLAHESFGHGMEADTMMKGRALASIWSGKKIGSDAINIIDYPAIEGKHGEFYFDHDGNLAKKTYLVKKGVVNEPMADLYSKSKLNLKSSSNARAESFDHKLYARMSNTYFDTGDKTKDELLSEIKEGIYIIESNGGMEDPKGWGVQIQGCFGQKIKDGKLVDEFYDGFTLTGFLPEIIKNISGISKEFEIEGGGSCGKGHKEWVRVSEGGPYLLIEELILG